MSARVICPTLDPVNDGFDPMERGEPARSY
jgi:hypothetical protein